MWVVIAYLKAGHSADVRVTLGIGHGSDHQKGVSKWFQKLREELHCSQFSNVLVTSKKRDSMGKLIKEYPSSLKL